MITTIHSLGLASGLTLVTDSQDVAAVKAHIGQLADGYDAFFVRVDDGDYSEVWGFCGAVPYLSKLVTRLV